MGIFTIFGTSLRALNAYSGAMGVVANNIANSSNENYSRQRVSFATLTPETFGGVETGRGLELAGVEQIVNNVIELRFNTAKQDLGLGDAKAEHLAGIESVFNEVSGDGLNQALAEFFNAWTAASAEPESTTVRQNILNSAETVVDMFNSYGESLVQTREVINTEIKNLVPTINSKLQQIADLNQKIRESDNGSLALKDERRKVLNELGELIDISYIEAEEDMQVYLKSGVPLVNGATVAELDVEIDVTNDNLYDISYTLGSTTGNITERISGGRLAGLIEARDGDLPDYQDKLDDLAYTFANQINSLHSAGYDLNGSTGNDFFSDLGVSVNDAARRLSIDAAVDGTPRALALSGDAAEIPGGNTVALSIANLFDDSSVTFDDGTSNSFSGYFGDLIARIGNDSSLAQNTSEFSQSVLDQIELERTQESGVSVDEEQINLIKLQAAYEASGRLVQIADSIIETLLGALGA